MRRFLLLGTIDTTRLIGVSFICLVFLFGGMWLPLLFFLPLTAFLWVAAFQRTLIFSDSLLTVHRIFGVTALPYEEVTAVQSLGNGYISIVSRKGYAHIDLSPYDFKDGGEWQEMLTVLAERVPQAAWDKDIQRKAV